MKTFFVICFLAIFADGADRSKNKNILTKMGLPATDELAQQNIVGGKEAVPHSLPYQVGIYSVTEKGKLWCGGSLISTKYVITAAHCADKMGDFFVYLGSHKITKRIKGELIIKVPKRNSVIHKKWNAKNSNNDIALIRLPKAIQLNKKIQLVNLPPRSLSKSKLEGKVVTISGWGRLNNSFDSHVLRYVNSRISSVKECKRNFPSYASPTHICTKRFDGKPICVGDSGGPLVLARSDGSKTLVGLASSGSSKGCASGGPIAFTRITPYLDWISSHTGVPVKE